MKVDSTSICFIPSLLCNGDVVNCCMDKKSESIMGTINENNSLDDILESERYRDFLRSITSPSGWGYCNKIECRERPIPIGS